MGDDYRAYAAAKLKAGQEYQDFVARQLLRDGIALVNYQSYRAQLEWGENSLGMEIKFDDLLQRTGNVYIETAEKSHPSNPDFVDSGIYRADNSWLYAVGNFRELFVFSKRTLKKAHAWTRQDGAPRFERRTTKTSVAFLLPRPDAVELAERLFAWHAGAWEDPGGADLRAAALLASPSPTVAAPLELDPPRRQMRLFGSED